MQSRRAFGFTVLASFLRLRATPLKAGTLVGGVRLGVQTYSFRGLPRTPDGDAIGPLVRALVDCGFDECELWAPQVEPAGKSREELRAWRLSTPLDHFRAVRKRFDDAGVRIYAYNYSPNASYTDAEIDRGFEMAGALGAEIVTSSTKLDVAARIAPMADTHRMVVAMHGHSNVADPNEFATPDSFARAMAMSKYFKVNLDIGHFTAGGFDAVPFIREHHGDITNLHIKDMKRNRPESYVPWGEGDAPIRDVLQLLKHERWPVRAYVEYEYAGQGTPVEETKRCYEYAKASLA
jgi:sugar phosphate isomerase/epimerase